METLQEVVQAAIDSFNNPTIHKENNTLPECFGKRKDEERKENCAKTLCKYGGQRNEPITRKSMSKLVMQPSFRASCKPNTRKMVDMYSMLDCHTCIFVSYFWGFQMPTIPCVFGRTELQ